MTGLDPTTAWLVVLGLALVTYALRASFLLGIDVVDGVPPMVERVLPFVPLAVLAALVAPNLFVASGRIVVGPGNERLVAGLVAVGVAWYTESMPATVGIGMLTLWLLVWL